MLNPGMTRVILAVNGHRCQYCGGVAVGADHIIPVAIGGGDDAENLTAACRHCNSSKGKKRLSNECEKKLRASAFIHADLVRSIHSAYSHAKKMSRQNFVKGWK